MALTARTHTPRGAGSEWNDRRLRAAAGAAAGVLGAILMGLFLMAYTTGVGLGAWYFPRAVAGVLFDEGAIAGDTGTIVLGTLLHLATGAMLGVLFAFLAGRRTGAGALLAGIAFALAIALVMTWGVVPSLNPVLARAVPEMWWPWFLAHACYGVGLAFTPMFVSPPVRFLPGAPSHRLRA